MAEGLNKSTRRKMISRTYEKVQRFIISKLICNTLKIPFGSYPQYFLNYDYRKSIVKAAVWFQAVVETYNPVIFVYDLMIEG